MARILSVSRTNDIRLAWEKTLQGTHSIQGRLQLYSASVDLYLFFFLPLPHSYFSIPVGGEAIRFLFVPLVAISSFPDLLSGLTLKSTWPLILNKIKGHPQPRQSIEYLFFGRKLAILFYSVVPGVNRKRPLRSRGSRRR